MDCLAMGSQIDAPIQHHLEQQVLRRAVGLDVVNVNQTGLCDASGV
jgi:hypothetical protein